LALPWVESLALPSLTREQTPLRTIKRLPNNGSIIGLELHVSACSPDFFSKSTREYPNGSGCLCLGLFLLILNDKSAQRRGEQAHNWITSRSSRVALGASYLYNMRSAKTNFYRSRPGFSGPSERLSLSCNLFSHTALVLSAHDKFENRRLGTTQGMVLALSMRFLRAHLACQAIFAKIAVEALVFLSFDVHTS
jgi:hypothetical protein